jgi:hypothetical protein
LTFYIFLSCFYILTYLFHPEALRRAEERANDLEKRLKASEEARKKAEEDAAGLEDLRRRLQATEDASIDREAELVQRDNDIITRLETQSRRFSSNTIFHFVIPLFLVLKLCLVLMKS